MPRVCLSWLAGALALAVLATSGVAAEPGGVRIASMTAADARESSSRLDPLIRDRRLRTARVDEDTLLPGHIHERLAQFHRGVPILGGEVVRQRDASGDVVSVFGRLYEGIDLADEPAVSAAQARALAGERAGKDAVFLGDPRLAIVPVSDGTLALSWGVVATMGVDVRQYYVDAKDGRLLLEHSLVSRQTPTVGRGSGVFSNAHKVSVAASGGQFIAIDMLRPARITTYDLRGNALRANSVVNQLFMGVLPSNSDIAADADNNWTDGPTVDAHAYAGWVYDFFFKRFGRRGWNGADLAMPQIVNPVRQEDFFVFGGALPLFFANAFFCCSGLPTNFMLYGQGIPAGVLPGGQVRPIAGALDAVAHEITHGMNKFGSGLSNAFCFAGGLNESFSDQMGVSVDFFYRPSTANYRVGEQVFPGGIRDMSNPGLFGHPDHLAVATICEEHILSGVPNQAFYLAIEGGTNRTSGIRVQGVGAANREQIERVFYRAFTFMLTPSSDYIDAGNATILAARQLFGAGSSVERAVFDAWVAVLFL